MRKQLQNDPFISVEENEYAWEFFQTSEVSDKQSFFKKRIYSKLIILERKQNKSILKGCPKPYLTSRVEAGAWGLLSSGSAWTTIVRSCLKNWRKKKTHPKQQKTLKRGYLLQKKKVGLCAPVGEGTHAHTSMHIHVCRGSYQQLPLLLPNYSLKILTVLYSSRPLFTLTSISFILLNV